MLAELDASEIETGANPSSFDFLAPFPGRTPTITPIPLSRKFIAWARPWFPYPNTATDRSASILAKATSDPRKSQGLADVSSGPVPKR